MHVQHVFYVPVFQAQLKSLKHAENAFLEFPAVKHSNPTSLYVFDRYLKVSSKRARKAG